MKDRWLGSGLRRLVRLPASLRRVERDIDDELHFHLESRVADLVALGHSRDDARRMARQEYGDITASHAELAAVDRRILRRQRRTEWLDVIRQDFTYALRGVRRQPAFAATIAVTLALAVGANAAVFSLIDPLLFRPPPGVPDPGSVRRLYTNHPQSLHAESGRSINLRFSYPEYLALRDGLTGLARVAAYVSLDSTSVIRGGDTLVASVVAATAEFLPMLAPRAARGRYFSAEDDNVRNPAYVAVVSQRFARRAFGADVDPLGKELTWRGRRYAVVGVTGEQFAGIDWTASDIWVPFGARPQIGTNRGKPWYELGDVYIPVVARVLDARTTDRALETRATVAYGRALTSTRRTEQGRSVLMGPILTARGPAALDKEVSISTRLAGVAVMVLLIAAANVGNLLLVRALRRRREIAVRLALGVSRSRLATQLLTESLVLGGIAGVAAFAVATWTGAGLRLSLLPRVRWIDAPIGPRVLVFGALVMIVTALVAGLIPATLASRLTLSAALKGGARDGIVQRSRLRTALLLLQTAFSVILLIGAALFARSLSNVRGIDLGYDADRLVKATVGGVDNRARADVLAAVPDLTARLASMPGVASASYATGAPFDSWMSVDLFRPGEDSAVRTRPNVPWFVAASVDYFTTTGTRIVAGRGFSKSDGPNSTPIMIVSTTMAKTLWPDRNPLGQCLIPLDRTRPCYRVVGVAEDAHQLSIIEKQPGMQYYLPVTQSPMGGSPRLMLIRTQADARDIVAMVREELRRALPGTTVTVQAMTQALEPQLRPWRLGAQLFAALSLLALCVAAIGVYSVVAFVAGQRTHEMGVRAALGAQRGDLLRLVVGQGAGVVAVGVALGVAGALASGKLVSSLLYGVTPRDPIALLVAAVTLLGVGVMASLGPAWRASRVDPALALRDD